MARCTAGGLVPGSGPRPRRVRATRGPPAGSPEGARVFFDPSARVEAARPLEARTPSTPERPSDTDLLEKRTEPGGASRCSLGAALRSDSIRTLQTRHRPRTPFPVLVDAPGGSAERALVPPSWTSRRTPPDHALPPRLAATSDASSSGAPGPLGGRTGPVTDRTSAAQGPRRAGSPRSSPSPLHHAPQTPPGRPQDGPGRLDATIHPPRPPNSPTGPVHHICIISGTCARLPSRSLI